MGRVPSRDSGSTGQCLFGFSAPSVHPLKYSEAGFSCPGCLSSRRLLLPGPLARPHSYFSQTSDLTVSTRSFPVPPAPSLNEQRGQTFARLVALMQRLLADDGCAWDREQTFDSMRRYVLEEACEVIDAIDAQDWTLLQEELGDLALQVVFLSEMARKAHGFGPDDVMTGICEKLVRRHPHVFSDEQALDADAVAMQWEAIKALEKPRSTRLLGRIPRALPALERARALSEKAAKVGFDWPDTQGSRAKVAEELEEVDEAIASGNQAKIEDEIGDLLFAAVNLARHHGVDPTVALHSTCAKFTRRFAQVEDQVDAQHGGWPRNEAGKPSRGIELDTLEQFWLQAKHQETS